MPIPTYDELMLPLLRLLRDGKEYSLREAAQHISDQYNLTQEERGKLVPSGQQRVIDNRVGWARTFLKKAEMVEYPHRGHMRILERGKELLKKNPSELTVDNLRQYPEFEQNWDTGGRKSDKQKQPEEISGDATPEEKMEYAYAQLSSNLEDELSEQVKNCNPRFFENLVVELLLKMGYGGSRKDAGEAIGKSGDGGIDGIIKEDRLGLDVVYIQAKRWEGVVGRPEIQKFAGALQGNRARKGVFITTSSFTNDALAFTQNLDAKIILIDGRRLAQLMIEHGVGVSPVATYTARRIDSDYFSEV